MKPDKKSIVQNLKTLYQLPKDKKLLQHLQMELMRMHDIATGKIIEELFEMQRTSHGFDPVILSKARVRRMKPTDYIQLLVRIDADLQTIMDTNEYVNLLNNSSAGYTNLLTRFMSIQRKLEMGFLNGLETEINGLQKDLITSGEFELLLSLNKVCGNFFQQNNNPERAGDFAKDYNRILRQLNEN